MQRRRTTVAPPHSSASLIATLEHPLESEDQTDQESTTVAEAMPAPAIHVAAEREDIQHRDFPWKQQRSHNGNSLFGRSKGVLVSLCYCWCKCVGTCGMMLVLLLVFIQEGHHLTCNINGSLCTPFRHYINRFPKLPQRDADTAIVKAQPLAAHSCQRFEEFFAMHPHPEGGRRLLFLIGESRGGSTYAYDTLNLHPEIEMVGGEALFSFSKNVCNNNQLLRDKKECNFDRWLETLYQKAFARKSDSKRLVGTKINLEQIPPEFYTDLASFLACIRNSAVVLQVTRASAIASFLNYQMEVPERIQASNFDMSKNSVVEGLNRPLELDAELAARWVHTRDQLSQDLFWTLAFAAPKALFYQRVYYEHLKDPEVGDRYWMGVFSFLGVNASLSVQALRSNENRRTNIRTREKTHGNSTCSVRISNWEAVKAALGPNSLSSIVCEGYSR